MAASSSAKANTRSERSAGLVSTDLVCSGPLTCGGTPTPRAAHWDPVDSPARALPPSPAPVGDVLVDWFTEAARDLPWRRPDTDPWAVLVSEVMLQQTPVARVEPVWREWVARWPTPAALAAASPADVIRAWGKLGYPRRALRLREAAVAMAQAHGRVVPSSVAELEARPGIGPYTARAVACFGYGQAQPVVDTNVRRVVARVLHGRAEAGTARAADLADIAALTPTAPERAVRFSVAAMELGALVCVDRKS